MPQAEACVGMKRNRCLLAVPQKFGPDGYSLLHRATWRPGEPAVDALVYLLDFLDVDTRAVRACTSFGLAGAFASVKVTLADRSFLSSEIDCGSGGPAQLSFTQSPV